MSDVFDVATPDNTVVEQEFEIQVGGKELLGSLKTVIGVVTGLVGAMGLIITANGGDLSLNALIYSLLPLAGSACYALNLNIIKIYLSNISAVLITGVSFFIIGPISISNSFGLPKVWVEILPLIILVSSS